MNQFEKFAPATLAESHLRGGFWGHRTENYMEIMDSMLDALLCPTNSARLLNFGIAAGELEGEFFGADWSDGDCYKFLEGCCYVYQNTGDKAVLDKIQPYIEWILKSQQPDGYINTQITLKNRPRWEQPMNHELYNHGHMFTLAAAYDVATGDHRLVECATRLMEYLYTVFEGYPQDKALFGANPSQIMGLCDLYQVTGNDRCWKLAEIFVNMRGSSKGNKGSGDQNQNRTPLREETMAVGHAVTSTYLYAGAADVYAQTGEKALLDALERIWKDIMEKRSYITGASSPAFVGYSEHGDLTHEAHAAQYELPNKVAYNESCANIGQAMWAMRMLGLTENVEYGDWAERIMYNSGISGSSLNLTRYFYSNPLSYRKDTPISQNFTQYMHKSSRRWHTFTCWCCPPQLFRTMAGIGRWVFGNNAESVYVNLFNNCDYEKDGMKLEMRCNYPWEDTITLHISETTGKNVKIRIPAWCETPIVNGKVVAAGQYAVLTPCKGDTITVKLPMKPIIMQANPNIEPDRGMLCILRGPVVYCAEGMDQNYPLDELYLDPDATLQEAFVPDLLDGVVTITTQAVRKPEQKALYYAYVREQSKTTLKLIPYYAWANREEADMSVWFPKA